VAFQVPVSGSCFRDLVFVCVLKYAISEPVLEYRFQRCDSGSLFFVFGMSSRTGTFWRLSSAMAVAAEGGLVDDSLGGYAFGAEMFPARVA
jgi:hypothetical protein